MKEIPLYRLDERHRPVHRIEGDFPAFGYNVPGKVFPIRNFELYSSQGLRLHTMGPLRSDFYRIGLVLRGHCDIQLGLEHFVQVPGTVNCTFPNQLFSKWNISDDIFGYYILFNPGFLDGLLPDALIGEEFPFFSYSGNAFFQLATDSIRRMEDLLFRINDELQDQRTGREEVIQHYLYLILLELKRNYRPPGTDVGETAALVRKFRQLVNEYYLSRQRVSDYAELLHVTPNHLNRMVKEVSGRTASDVIAEMILQEAKVLLRYTDQSVSEIAYCLSFSEPSSFNRFFKKGAGLTPREYRENAGSGQ